MIMATTQKFQKVHTIGICTDKAFEVCESIQGHIEILTTHVLKSTPIQRNINSTL